MQKLIILTNDGKHEIAGNVKRMRFSRALSRTVRSRAIRHRIIRRQVRCGSQQLGKLEGAVFYFRDVQRVFAPRVSLPFALNVVGSFLRPYPLQQSFPAPSQSSFVNATESETRRQMSRAGITPCRLFSYFSFSYASGYEQVVIILHIHHISYMLKKYSLSLILVSTYC